MTSPNFQFLCSNVFEFFKETCPLYFCDIYRQSSQNQANTRSSVLKLKHPLRNTCSDEKKLSHLTPIVWNSLPTDLDWRIHLMISNISWKTIFSRNLETWNKISLLIDAVLGTSTVINFKLVFLLFIMLQCFTLIFSNSLSIDWSSFSRDS